jgi:hypothetical protein
MSNAQKLSQAVAGGQTAIQADDIGVTLQAQLVSGTNIKTLNGESLLGSGAVVAKLNGL